MSADSIAEVSNRGPRSSPCTIIVPYSFPDLTMSSIRFGATHEFHPIYSLPSGSAQRALDEIEDDDLDAIVMLGTGMPTLAPIARTPFKGKTPVLSCMFCVVWLSVLLAARETADAESLRAWLKGAWWRERMAYAPLA